MFSGNAIYDVLDIDEATLFFKFTGVRIRLESSWFIVSTVLAATATVICLLIANRLKQWLLNHGKRLSFKEVHTKPYRRRQLLLVVLLITDDFPVLFLEIDGWDGGKGTLNSVMHHRPIFLRSAVWSLESRFSSLRISCYFCWMMRTIFVGALGMICCWCRSILWKKGLDCRRPIIYIPQRIHQAIVNVHWSVQISKCEQNKLFACISLRLKCGTYDSELEPKKSYW